MLLSKKEQILELRKQSLGYGAIAKALDCNTDYVKQICREHGLGGVLARTTKTVKPPKEMLIKECKKCGNTFKTNRSKQVYCSVVCSKHTASKRRPAPFIQKLCNECDKPYEVKDTKTGHKRMFCSPSCATSFQNKQRKPTREGSKQKHLDFVEKVIDKYDGEIEVLSMYTGWNKPIKLRCNECGKIWWKPQARETLRAKCACNGVSSGEAIITDYLLDNQVYFEREKSFDDLTYQKPLRYDFYLPELNILIEYDGEHHFKPIETFGGKKHLEETLLRDEMKNEYARIKVINLIRISFEKKKNIKQILDKVLKA